MEVYAVRYRGEVIGTSTLEHLDDGMSVAWGAFRPAPAYAAVRGVFRLFAEAMPGTSQEPADEAKLAQYYAARDALGLELADSAGQVIPTGFLHIADLSEEDGPEAYELEVQLTDPRAWASCRTTHVTG